MTSPSWFMSFTLLDCPWYVSCQSVHGKVLNICGKLVDHEPEILNIKDLIHVT